MENGDSNPKKWYADKEEYKRCRKRFEDNFESILQGYKQVDESFLQGLDKVFSDSAATRVSRMDVAKEHKAILKAMKTDTKGALGFDHFDLSHTMSIGGFTAEDLSGWVVHAGWLVYTDGRVKAYVGSSIAEDGRWTVPIDMQ